MKKLTAILLITTTFLTACGTDGSSDTGKETTTQGQTIEETQEKTLPEAIENVDTSIEYDSMDIFLSSDFVLNLKEKGWSENTDLSSADEQTVSTIKGTGVELKGFAGSNKMAYIDFTELLRTLPKDNPVDIKLTVTDKLNKAMNILVKIK